jgi:hypothetical protein
MRVGPANARVTAHFGRGLADQALEQGSDPDDARSARGETDFLTDSTSARVRGGCGDGSLKKR